MLIDSITGLLPKRLKLALTAALCSRPVGAVIALLYRNRIPHGANRVLVGPVVTRQTIGLLYWGLYESAERRMLKYLPSDLDVIELGSSLGVISMQIRRVLEPGRMLVCVEADPRLLPLLTANVRAVSDRNDTVIINAAVDYRSTNGRISFATGETNIVGSVSENATENSVWVDCVALETIVARSGVGDFALVMDIEGSEATVFENSDLSRCKWLIAELHDTTYEGRPYDVEAMIRRCLALGFVLRERAGNVCAFEATAMA